MVKGGYQIVDLKSKNLTEREGMVYEDIYDIIEGTQKPIYVSGLRVSDIDIKDGYYNVIVEGSNFILIGDRYIIKINDNDVVIAYAKTHTLKLSGEINGSLDEIKEDIRLAFKYGEIFIESSVDSLSKVVYISINTDDIIVKSTEHELMIGDDGNYAEN